MIIKGNDVMSYCTTIFVEVDDVPESTVLEIMEELGWDGEITDNISGTAYYAGMGSICMGTSEAKQGELVRELFNTKLNKEIDVSISWE